MENERSVTKEGQKIDFFQCQFCGAVMYPRRFEKDETVVWGLFDNCYENKLVFETLNEAIENYLNA